MNRVVWHAAACLPSPKSRVPLAYLRKQQKEQVGRPWMRSSSPACQQNLSQLPQLCNLSLSAAGIPLNLLDNVLQPMRLTRLSLSSVILHPMSST